MSKLLRHKNATPCDTGGRRRIVDVLRVNAQYWGRDSMGLKFLFSLVKG